MSSLFPKHAAIAYYILSAIVIIIIVLGSIFLSGLNSDVADLSAEVNGLKQSLASTTADLQKSIASNHNSLFNDLQQEKQSVGTLKEQLGNYQEKVGTVTNTVETLQKLSKTDPQLLAKYSKVFFLNEYYAPARLIEIPAAYQYNESKHLKIQTDIWPHLETLLSDSAKDGVRIYVQSAYRSFNEQEALKGQYSVVYGAGTANQFSADQGYSEHQLGTTVDLVTTGMNGQLDGFDDTKAYTWLRANAYKYGFILSYPPNNKFYVFEPWHWRYVGVKLATYLHNQNMNFYDMDQRKIDEYLVNFFE